MDLFSANLFEKSDSSVPDSSDKEKDIKKLKAFADVEDTENSILEQHVAAKEKSVQLDFDADETVLENILNNKPKVESRTFKPTEPNINNKMEANTVESGQQTTSPKEAAYVKKEQNEKQTHFDQTLDSIDEIGEKAALKFLGGVKFACQQLKILLAYTLSDYQDKKIHKRFEKGEHVIAGDFEFLLQNKELMVFKYCSTSPHVLIPDYVGNLPVKYIYRGFLNRNLFDNHKVRSFISYFKEENVADLSLDALKESCAGIKSLQFPSELVYVPRKLFSGMKLIKNIIIPASVKLVSPSAFSKSNLTNIYFDGDVPRNMHLLLLPENCNVYCKEYYAINYENQFTRRKQFYKNEEIKEEEK